jgi:signal transduction histidine kinase
LQNRSHVLDTGQIRDGCLPDANEKVKEYLGIIETETHTADKIISDLLDFSRIKSVDVDPVAVSDLIQRTLERFPAPKMCG